MKNPVRKWKRIACKSLGVGSAGLSVLALLSNHAEAQNTYFDVNGATSGYGQVANGTYDWEGSYWGVSGGTGGTTSFTSGTFPRFYGNVSYTVNVTNVESIAGMYVNNGSGHSVTFTGPGGLSIVTGDQGFLGASGTTTYLNVPVSGGGGLAPETGGTLYLNAHNTYSGGTTFGYSSGSPLVYFNNNDAFGTGAIISTYTSGTVAPLLSYGGTAATPLTITLANAFSITGASAGFNFANSAYTPVVLTGNFDAGANTLLIKNNGNATAPLTLAGNINSSGKVTLAGNNGGTIIVSGDNLSLSGTVAIGASGGQANVTVKLAAADTFAQASKLSMDGGKLDFGGFFHNMNGTTMALTANSTLDFAGGGVAHFGNSSGESWVGILDLLNYDGLSLYFGTDATGLTAAQLAKISFNGGDLGYAQITADGLIIDAVPEPSTVALGLLGGFGMFWAARRRARKA